MNKFRFSVWSTCIRFVCVFLIIFQPLVLMARVNIEQDERNRILTIYDQPSQAEWIEFFGKDDHSSPWQIINAGTLELTYEDLQRITDVGVFYNSGTVICSVPEDVRELTLPYFHNLNMLQFYGEGSVLDRVLHISSWVNEGTISFFNHNCGINRDLHDKWNIFVDKFIDNRGVIKSDTDIALTHNYGTDVSLTGIIDGRNLHINGFDTIQAILVSGFDALFDRESGAVQVEFSRNEESNCFDWGGLVCAKGDVNLLLKKEKPEVLSACISAYISAEGFKIDVNTQTSAAVSLNPDYKAGIDVLSILIQQNREVAHYLKDLGMVQFDEKSYLGYKGLRVNFSNESGDLFVDGDLESEGPIKLLKAKHLEIGKESHLTSKKTIYINNAEVNGRLNMNGVLKSPDIKIKTHSWHSQRGTLDGSKVIIDAHNGGYKGGNPKSVHLNHVKFGSSLKHLVLVSSGKIQFESLFQEGLLPEIIDIEAQGIGILTPITASQKIRLVSKSSLVLNADVLSDNELALQGDILFKGDNENSSYKITLKGKNVAFDHKTSTELLIPVYVHCEANDYIRFLADAARVVFEGPLLGKYLEIQSRSACFNRTPSVNILNVKVMDRLNVNVGLRGLSLAELTSSDKGYIYTNDVETRHLNINSFFMGSRHSVLSVMEPSVIDADFLRLEDVTVRTNDNPLQLVGDDHVLKNVDASDAFLQQRSSVLTFDGDCRVGVLETKNVTTVLPESTLHVRHIDVDTDQDELNILGSLTTEQENIHLRAQNLIIKILQRVDDAPFDKVTLEGEVGDISTDISTNNGRIAFNKKLTLRSNIMADVFSIIAHDMLIEESILDVDRLTVEGDKGEFRDVLLTGGDHLVQMDSTLSVKETDFDVDHLKVRAEEAELQGMRGQAQTLEVEAKEGRLNPSALKAKEARISFSKYQDGLRGAIRLAHDLINCENVRIEALSEDLLLDSDTTWRDNFVLATRSAHIKAALKGGEGHLGLETEDEMRVEAPITAGSLEFLSRAGNVLFHRAILKAVNDNILISAEKGNVVMQASQAEAAKDISIEGVNILLESLKRRSGGGGNYADSKEGTTISTGHNLYIQAQNTIYQKGITTRSGQDTRLMAGVDIINEALRLERQSYSEHKRGYSREYHLHHDVSDHTAGGVYVAQAGHAQELFAPRIHARKITLIAEQDINIHDNQDVHTYESSTRKKGGWFGSSKMVRTQGGSSRSGGSTMQSAEPIEFLSTHGNISLTNVNFQAPRTILKAMEGLIEILQGRNSAWYSRSKQSSNVVWQSQKAESEKHETYSQSRFSGPVEVCSKETIIEQVRGKTLDFIKDLDQYGGSISYRWLQETHERHVQEVSGISGPCSIVLALAISIATSGLASGLGLSAATAAGQTATVTALNAAGVMAQTTVISTTTGAVISGMTAAAFTGLCTQSAFAIINSQGDLGKAARTLASSQTLKSIAFNTITGGITCGLAKHLGVDISSGQKGFMEHLQSQSLQAGVSGGVNIATGGRTDESLQNCLKSIVAGTLGAYMANQIGNAYSPKSRTPIDPITHKLLHAALGGMTGAIVGENPERGAIAGAMGAFIAETFTDVFKPDNELSKMGLKVKEGEEQKGRELTKEEFHTLYTDELKNYNKQAQSVADWGKLTAATVSLLSGQDVSTSIYTATNAVENNFVHLAIYAVMGCSILYSVYEIKTAYDKGGVESALKKLGIEVVTIAAGGVIGKGICAGGKIAFRFIGKTKVYYSAAEILSIAYEKTPGLKYCVEGIHQKLVSAFEKFESTNVGQTLAAADSAVHQASDKLFRRIFDSKTVKVRDVQWGKGVHEQGMPFEDFIASKLPEGSRLPKNFKTFDYYDDVAKRAVSVKTLDTQTLAKLENPNQIYQSLKRNVDAIVNFEKYERPAFSLYSHQIRMAELHVGIPHNTSPLQRTFVDRAIDYAQLNGIKMEIFHVY
jgi:hypothetical protein